MIDITHDSKVIWLIAYEKYAKKCRKSKILNYGECLNKL